MENIAMDSLPHDDHCERIEVDIGVGVQVSPCGCYERGLLAKLTAALSASAAKEGKS